MVTLFFASWKSSLSWWRTCCTFLETVLYSTKKGSSTVVMSSDGMLMILKQWKISADLTAVNEVRAALRLMLLSNGLGSIWKGSFLSGGVSRTPFKGIHEMKSQPGRAENSQRYFYRSAGQKQTAQQRKANLINSNDEVNFKHVQLIYTLKNMVLQWVP